MVMSFFGNQPQLPPEQNKHVLYCDIPNGALSKGGRFSLAHDSRN